MYAFPFIRIPRVQVFMGVEVTSHEQHRRRRVWGASEIAARIGPVPPQLAYKYRGSDIDIRQVASVLPRVEERLSISVRRVSDSTVQQF
ncbi:hypothetical protein EVAR_88165_1 [Eumeta japonica]|uniref:Uncharacterized protein n=1 Tax=Eumeta variegata TaxID=151549 RepID=A0A4C1WEW1_EUMVA|nr:hypothetical protein EVAR_88165_1 [Eumeta japonica]